MTSSKEEEATDQSVLASETTPIARPDGHGFFETIPEVDEQLAEDMWDAVHKHAKENWSDDNASPPFSEMNLDHPKDNPKNSQSDKVSEPSDLGQYIDRAATLYIPSVKIPEPPELVDVDLEKLLAAPVLCTLPLGELLKLKPELLKGIV